MPPRQTVQPAQKPASAPQEPAAAAPTSPAVPASDTAPTGQPAAENQTQEPPATTTATTDPAPEQATTEEGQPSTTDAVETKGDRYRCIADGDFTLRLPNSRHLGRKVAPGAIVVLTDDEYLANSSKFEPVAKGE